MNRYRAHLLIPVEIDLLASSQHIAEQRALSTRLVLSDEVRNHFPAEPAFLLTCVGFPESVTVKQLVMETSA